MEEQKMYDLINTLMEALGYEDWDFIEPKTTELYSSGKTTGEGMTFKSMVDMSNRIKTYNKTFYYLPEVDNVKFYDKATVVFWKDHTKTVVIRQPEDQDDKEKALAMCFLKKLFGNKGNYNDIFRKYIPEEV